MRLTLSVENGWERLREWRWPIELMACLCLIVGAKFWLISAAGSVVPYWDQWDAEAAYLYEPYLSGELGAGHLLATHNEHRIVFTRLLGLIQLELLGYWDPVVQMIVNALIHVLVIALILSFMARSLSPDRRTILALFAACAVAIPFSHENTLAGFQSPFYLLLGSSALSLYLIATAPTWSSRWWAGAFAGVLSFLCMASGMLTPLAAAAIMAIQVCLKARPFRTSAGAIMLLGLLACAEFMLTPTLAQHDALRATNLRQFTEALISTSTWPTAPLLTTMLLIHAPLIALAIHLTRAPPAVNSRIWFYLAMAIWIALQFVSIALSRATTPRSLRYLDIHTVGLFLNFAALLYVLAQARLRRPVTIWIAATWTAWISLLLLTSAYTQLPSAIAEKQALISSQRTNVSDYLSTGDRAALRGKSFYEIPYWDQERLGELLDRPGIRGLLSIELVNEPSARRAVQARLNLDGGWPGLGPNLRRGAAALGRFLPILAVLLFVLAAMLALHRPAAGLRDWQRRSKVTA